ncbi:rhomboid family intramembrane serine protease [Haloferax sp. DFSO60]|uniref:rhomboid family intramembrane serine protease n=1 Tax=Haloferax sp. DFSO60 TaxID=3388652 RepID=UPI0039788682
MAETDWTSFSDERHPGADETLAGAVVRNPVVQTLFVMLVVSTATWISAVVGFGRNLFVLSAPLATYPWTLVTSVYAHVGPGHLLSNAVVIVVFGGIVALSTTNLRFHLFFVVTGMVAGVVQIVALSHRGVPVGVLGASGAAFALMGYVLASNLFSKFVLDRLNIPTWVGLLTVAFVAAVLTIQYSGPGSAVIAHFTGAVIGLVTGRMRLLHR